MTAASSAWQVNSEPVVFQSIVYYPTREYRIFDGQVMAQIGVYEQVPVYADTTLEPWSIVYVPVGRERMRAYERPRNRELTGTSGSRAPSFATRPASVGLPVPSQSAPPPAPAPVPVAVPEDRPVGTAGTIVPRAMGSVLDIPERTRATRTRVESIPRPLATNGVWLEFNGNRWYSAGSAVTFVPARFTPIGQYRGFPVYRSYDDPNRIYVSVVQDGPVAPYEKR